MHDIDRTQLEFAELEGGPPQQLGEQELGELSGEAGALEGPQGELHEIELATELLEVAGEQELDRFLGTLISRAGKAAGRFIQSDTGQALGGILKDAARRALPAIGRGVGQWLSPGQGGDLGADAGALVGQALGLELEGLSHEDREFAVARQLIRFARAAARQAALGAGGSPIDAARRAAASAARRHAPGLLRRLPGRSSGAWPRGGRWLRRGRTIVLFGG